MLGDLQSHQPLPRASLSSGDIYWPLKCFSLSPTRTGSKVFRALILSLLKHENSAPPPHHPDLFV